MSLDPTHRGTPAGAPPDAHADRLKFNGDNSFHRELRRRVDAEFKRSGTRQRDSAQMYLKTAIILGVFALAYAALVFVADTWWQACCSASCWASRWRRSASTSCTTAATRRTPSGAG